MIIKEINKLNSTCESLINVIPETVNWVNKYNIVPNENKKALKYQLNKFKRNTQRYKAALNKRPSIAIFGQSQVGKSYLVSNLVKLPEEKELKIIGSKQGEVIDFLDKINPPGGGKEATGIVSRFTVDYEFNTAQPYMLKLLSQADLLRIIINGYFSDLMNYGEDSYIDIDEFQSILDNFEKQKKSTIQAGFSEDDVFEVKEYIELNFKNHHISDKISPFWYKIASVIPYVEPTERWQIFHVLWGKRQFFTDLFIRLSKGLNKLKHKGIVYCGLDATKDKFETIVDVERLRELYNPSKTKEITVFLPSNESISIEMSVISALTAEIVLRLEKEIANHPKRIFLKQADVLDFPGARSREKTPEETFLKNSDIEKLQLFLRGKIAFLFDRYNYNHEISTLLYCHDNTPQNVKTIPHLIYDWIRRTHGGSSEEREEREQNLLKLLPESDIKKLIPLLFVLTKFNIELSKKEKDVNGHKGKWMSRLKENFSDFLSQPLTDKWATNWSNRDKSFKNSFLLRDPNPDFSFGVYETVDDVERPAPSFQKHLDDLTESFLGDANVKKHFRNPNEAWDDAVTANKNGGIHYIIEYLTPTCNPKIRIDRLKTLINGQISNVIQAFEGYVDSGDLASKLKKAKINAAKVFMHMMGWVKKSNGFGMFLDKLTLKEDEAWKVYWSLKSAPPKTTNNGHPETNEQSITTFKRYLDEAGILFDETKDVKWHIEQLKDFFGIADDESIKEILKESGINIEMLLSGGDNDHIKTEAEVFAEMLIENWYSKVLALKNDSELISSGLSKNIISLVCNTLDKSKERVNLKEILTKRVHNEVEHFLTSNNYNIVAHISTSTVNDYVNSLGWKFVDETISDYPKIKGIPIYSKQGVLTPKKKDLKMNIDYPGMLIFNEWNTGIKESFTANVLFEEKAGNTEDALIKQELSDIIKKLN